MQATLSIKQMARRADRLLRGAKAGAVTAETVRELAELHEELQDAPVKPVVVARLTATRADGTRSIVEIHEGADFHRFYHYYKQVGRRHSTKTWVRTSSRNEGIDPLRYHRPGLETVAANLIKCGQIVNPVVEVKIRIIRRRAYKQLTGCSPDQLGLTQCRSRLPVLSPAVS